MTRSEVSGSKDYDLGGPRIWGGVWGGCDQVLVENVFLQFFKDFDISMNNKIILKTDLQRDLSGKSQPSWKSVQTTKKTRLNSPKNHMCRWYDDTQLCKISYSINSTSFVKYKNNKFQARNLPIWFISNLLFLYLTNEIEFQQDIWQGYVSSYHLHMWFLCEFRRLFSSWFARVFTKIVISTM
jgi:hypothetical protein